MSQTDIYIWFALISCPAWYGKLSHQMYVWMKYWIVGSYGANLTLHVFRARRDICCLISVTRFSADGYCQVPCKGILILHTHEYFLFPCMNGNWICVLPLDSNRAQIYVISQTLGFTEQCASYHIATTVYVLPNGIMWANHPVTP